jgi:hypothetical protein
MFNNSSHKHYHHICRPVYCVQRSASIAQMNDLQFQHNIVLKLPISIIRVRFTILPTGKTVSISQHQLPQLISYTSANKQKAAPGISWSILPRTIWIYTREHLWPFSLDGQILYPQILIQSMNVFEHWLIITAILHLYTTTTSRFRFYSTTVNKLA